MLSVGYSLLLITALFASCAFANYGYLYLRDDRAVDTTELMNHVMGTIFIVFGTLKLVNLKQFATIFSKYDIVSHHIPYYGVIYPLIEILLGVSFFYPRTLTYSYSMTILLMSLSLIGVSMSMGRGASLRCGCLGSFFHIPLSYVTISENVVMITMAAYGLLRRESS